MVKVDAANDLALLKAAGKFAPLPIAASRTVALGGTVVTVGFSRHRFAWVRAQGAGARPSRGKSLLGSRASTGG
jgi:S1-C subfamily serine protease